METVYGIVPAGVRPFYVLLPTLVLLAGVVGLLSMAAYGSQQAGFVVSNSGLDFQGDFYGRKLAWSTLRIDEARVVDLTREPDLRPRWRRLGTGLPGYRAGWFRLSDGRRALLYLTTWQRVLYVPTNAGYVLLLSPLDPEGMLQELRRRAGVRG